MSGATLTYSGPAHRVTASVHNGYLAGEEVQIDGTFRIASEVEGGLILGDGAKPESYFLVASESEVVA